MKRYRPDRTTATSVRVFFPSLIFAVCFFAFYCSCLAFPCLHAQILQSHHSEAHTPLQALNPPSTNIVSPETKPDASLSRKINVPVSSAGLPKRPNAVLLTNRCARSVYDPLGLVSNVRFCSVRNTPGAIPFTRTLSPSRCASSTPIDMVYPTIAHFAML